MAGLQQLHFSLKHVFLCFSLTASLLPSLSLWASLLSFLTSHPDPM